MRTSGILDALFTKTRQGVLAAMFGQPQKWWYLSELARYLRTTPSSLQREIGSLVASGILKQRRESNRTYYKAQEQSPVFSELRSLMEKTTGTIPALQNALHPIQDRIECAFVYGSLARGDEHMASDIDLIVIGTAGLAELAPILRRLELRFGREVNVVTYSGREFCERLAAKDHFLSTVMAGRKLFVKGTQRDLERLTGKQRGTKTQDIEKRA